MYSIIILNILQLKYFTLSRMRVLTKGLVIQARCELALQCMGVNELQNRNYDAFGIKLA